MATNEILVFGGSAVSILSQANYALANPRTDGHETGVASSALANKVLLQTSTIASGLAQFMADNQSNNITDALTPANISTYLDTCVDNIVDPKIPVSATTSAEGLVEWATTAEAQNWATADKVVSPASLWVGHQGINQQRATGGWQNWMGSLVFQWGSPTATGSPYTHNFATSGKDFPFACLCVIACDAGATAETLTVTSFNKTGFSIRTASGSNCGLFSFMAIGY